MRNQYNRDILISSASVKLSAILEVPEQAKGLVLFVHGGGSSRLSPRNAFVAHYLREQGLGTLLFDLLTLEEALQDQVDHQFRFSISFLTQRLLRVTEWIKAQEQLKDLGLGYFAASTGGAAALDAAAILPSSCRAIVLRGARPDLALSALDRIRVPTLLLVGSEDQDVLRYNQTAYKAMVQAPYKRLTVIEGAGHLFEEPGTLEQVAQEAALWFAAHLPDTSAGQPTPFLEERTNNLDSRYCANHPC